MPYVGFVSRAIVPAQKGIKTMANYSIAYSCGHTADKQLYGKHDERQSYIAWAGKSGICPACAAANAQRAAEAVESEYALPALAGSDKQVAWARKIRAEKVGEAVKWMDAVAAKVPEAKLEAYAEQRARALQAFFAKTSASYWIDNKDANGRTLTEAAYKETLK
ncbi:hypothetical protein [Rhodomicrobium lacus]|uniref:hypothetical protein n=1 Tax=Rhodomicrobium lacus TaxID=2498452 RepID=UPI001AECCF10|nr:hypothetical protein [Rhodomicrobium lacus]